MNLRTESAGMVVGWDGPRMTAGLERAPRLLPLTEADNKTSVFIRTKLYDVVPWVG